MDYIRKTFTCEGTRYQVYGKTIEEAIEKMVEKKAALKRGQDTSGGNMTVDTWYRQWKTLYKDNSGMTAKSLKMYDEKYAHMAPIKNMRMKDIKEHHLQKVLNSQAGMSFSHVSKLRGVMMQMFSRARKSQIIERDPSEDLILPAYTKGKRRSLTDSERETMIAAANGHKAGLWVLTILYTGLRPGETAALRWGDIDLKANQIHVTAALESGSRQRKAPKTSAGIRIIPIHAELLPLLQSAQQEPTALVFPNYAGQPQSTDNLNNLWKGFVRDWDIKNGAELHRNKIIESTLATDLTPYVLRHTFCTDLERAGVPLNIAKYLMGHTDISTTANIYTHTDPKTLYPLHPKA